MSFGRLVEIPFGYIRFVLSPSGSIKIWCDNLSANLVTLSSIEGQYLGPTPSMAPLNKGDLPRELSIILCVSLLVLVM